MAVSRVGGLISRDVGMRFRGKEVGPASLGTSFAYQCRCILLAIENHHGEVEVEDLYHPR